MYLTAVLLAIASVSPCVKGATPGANDLGFVWLEAGEFEKAAALFRQAIGAEPGNAVIWNNLGCAYYRRREYVSAEPCFRKAVEINPAFARAWLNLASCLFRQGQYAKAYRSYLLARKADRLYVLTRMKQAQSQGWLDTCSPLLSPRDSERLQSLIDAEINSLSGSP